MKRKAFQADNARTPVRSAGKYVPPAASGSERCYRASNALAGGQFLPRQIKGSPVQHRIRQEGSPCCWSLCGAAWRYAEKTAPLPCRWGGGRKRRSAQVYRPSEAAASHGQGIIWPAQLPARQRPLHRLQARNFLRRNGHRQQSEGAPSLKQERIVSTAPKAFSV